MLVTFSHGFDGELAKRVIEDFFAALATEDCFDTLLRIFALASGAKALTLTS